MNFKISSVFAPLKRESISLHPFTYLTPSLRTTALCVLLFLLPQIIMLFVTKSAASLFILLATVLASILAEFLYNIIKKQFFVSWLYALICGIIIGFLLPSTYSPVAAFCITFATLFLCKYAFGGFASSWVNPAVITVIVAYMLNASAFPSYMLTSADLQARNAALSIIQGGTIPLVSTDSSITSFLNRTIFHFLGIVIPEGYVTLFWDSGSLIPAFRFNALTLLSSLLLISFDMIGALIPFVFIIVYAFLVKCAGPIFVGGIPLQGDVLLALLTSGTFFCTFYVLQWYGTTPISEKGKFLYAVCAGCVAFFIIGFGTSSIGYMFTILLMNVISALIQVWESKHTKKKIETNIIPRLKLMKEVEYV